MTTIEAVTRAYAEVMLCVAREAAARILAAERRAVVLAGGMAAARDDAVTTLVRLKAISDAKIKEAKLQSLAHVKKIQELETRLHSAQSTIASLEGELKRAHMKSNQTRTLAKQNRSSLSTSQKTDDRRMSSYRSKIHVRDRSKSPASSETNSVPRNTKEDANAGKIEDLHNCSNDLASLGVTQKESEFNYSRSVETPLGKMAGKAGQVTSLLVSGKKGIAKKSCCPEAEVLQTANLTYSKRRRSKRRESIYKHAVNIVQKETEYEAPNTSDGNGCMMLLRALEHDLSPMESFHRQGVNHSSDLLDGLQMARKEILNSCSANSGEGGTRQAKGIQMRKGKRSKSVLQRGGFCSNGALRSARSPLKEINGNVLRAKRISSVMVDGHFDGAWGTRGEPITHGTGDQGVIEKHSIHLNILSSFKDAYVDADTMPVDLSEHRKQEDNTSDKKEDENNHICNLDLDKSDTAVSSSTNEENAMMSSGTCNQTAGIQCIKYTFNSRKRKTKSEHNENSTDDSFPGKRIHLIGQVAPESQMLLEVATQLISLSEK